MPVSLLGYVVYIVFIALIFDILLEIIVYANYDLFGLFKFIDSLGLNTHRELRTDSKITY